MRIDATGGIALVTRTREIAEASGSSSARRRGSGRCAPTSAAPIHDHVFAPADAATTGQIAFEVRSALDRWEPRIDVLDVLVTADRPTPATLHIEIRYAIRGTNDPRNLVFPFYVIPAHAAMEEGGTS